MWSGSGRLSNRFFWSVDRCDLSTSKCLVFLFSFLVVLVLWRKATLLPPISYYLASDYASLLSVKIINRTKWSLSRRLDNAYPSGFQLLPTKRQPSYRRPSGDTSQIVILLWTTMFAKTNWGLGEAVDNYTVKQPDCPISNCYVTSDRSLLPKASAVLVHFRDDFDYSDLPIHRRWNQHWVFVLWESPEHTYSWNSITSRTSRRYLTDSFKSFFNWTMTYRLDSDIPLYYGGFQRNLFPSSNAPKTKLAGKLKFAVMIASNCFTAAHRLEYVHELQRFIDVDIIGDCGKSWFGDNGREDLPYPKSCVQQKNRGTSAECLQYLSANYKFLLAFENSLCQDYVTEKFFRAASLDLIPVVLNGANMSKFAPPDSYINSADFKSPELLAAYLRRVAIDQKLYNSYFWWKRYYSVGYYWDFDVFKRSFCHLCLKLNIAYNLEQTTDHIKVYDDIDTWWMRQGVCRQGRVADNQKARNIIERTIAAICMAVLFICVAKVKSRLCYRLKF